MGEIKKVLATFFEDKYMKQYWKSRRRLQGNFTMDVIRMPAAHVGEKRNAEERFDWKV
jgi:hypothetical protein